MKNTSILLIKSALINDFIDKTATLRFRELRFLLYFLLFRIRFAKVFDTTYENKASKSFLCKNGLFVKLGIDFIQLLGNGGGFFI